MTPTGNIYLQIFNRASGRFIELPANVATLSFATTPTGYVSFDQTANFSGFSFSRPIKINGSLDMAPINIGASNTTGSGSSFSANIGILNLNSITNLELATGGYLGNYNFGYANSSLNSINSYNFGYFNTSSNNQRSFLIGAANVGSGELDSINLGNGNSVNLADQILMFGQSNTINSGIDIVLVGSENTISKIQNYLSIGNTNTFLNSSNVENIGSNNDISGSSDLINFGDYNQYTNSLENTNFGNENIYASTSGTLNVGIGNSNSSSNGNIIFGNSNTVRGTGTNIFGEVNSILGNSHNVYGSLNNTELNNSSATIFGNNNDFSGTNSSTVYGSNNTLNSEVLDLLYRIELTGITGAGPTLFTGVTGYRVLGNYAGIPGSGGNNNFFVGNNNQTSLNNFVYAFGDSNQILNNGNSYIIGEDNYAERSDSSYIFGQNNSVSGFKNYIIGNNNIVRSGDYNNVLIGISHEFTGDFKIASINIASVDSSIEVSPGEVKINSPSRMKFNNDNITVSSDLNNYLNTSNGIPNSGTLNTTIFQDPEYNFLADEIELQTFAYSGRGERYYATFTGINYDGTQYNFINNFFIKKPIFHYSGNISLFGSSFYESSNQDAILGFSYAVPPYNGNWIIGRNIGQGVFYKNGTDVNFNNPPPLVGWTGFGINGLSGGNPAPILNYVTQFTGVFNRGKLRASLSNPTDNFSTITKSYPSQEISVIYGNHNNPQFEPTWLIVDNFSSGVYYINNNYTSSQTPQTGWLVTGFQGSSGSHIASPVGLIGSTGINLSMGTRVGVVLTNIEDLGRVYIPYFY